MTESAVGQPRPASAPRFIVPPDWRLPLLALACSVAVILGAYRETAIAMVTIWYRSETFTHAFLVPPIALWLIWRRRYDLARLTPEPAPIALVTMLGVALFWLLGDLTAVNSVTQLAFVALLVLTVPAVLGFQVARAVQFPLLFLFFAVPMGEFLMPVFMVWTADFTVGALRLSGVPVLREGLQFVIPSGNWSVVEACSGIRYLIASVTVGALFAYLNYRSTKRRVAFVLLSILVPVLANWLRAYMIVMIGHLSGNTLAVGVDHLIYGWVFFGVVIALMFTVGARWAEPDPSGAIKYSGALSGSKTPSSSAFVTAAALVIALTSWPFGARWWLDMHSSQGMAAWSNPPALAPEWELQQQSVLQFKPSFSNPSAESNSWYRSDKHAVGLYLAYYRHQDYDRKLVSSNNVVVGSSDPVWNQVASGPRTVVFGSAKASVRTMELRHHASTAAREPERLVVWQIYWINGTLTSSDYSAKVYSALYRLLGRGDDSAVIIVFAEKAPVGAKDAALESFMQANYGAIDAFLRQTQATR